MKLKNTLIRGVLSLHQVSDYELELLKIIWTNGNRAMYADIVAALEEKEMHWTKNTIITLLSRLINKDFLKIQKIGRRNEYIALIQENQYQTVQTQDFLDKIYNGNASNLVSTLIRKDLISAEEYMELKKCWEEGEGDR